MARIEIQGGRVPDVGCATLYNRRGTAQGRCRAATGGKEGSSWTLRAH